jgi:hypothetical protein
MKNYSIPWHRHAAWVLPTAACLVLVVALIGAFGLRQIIVVLRRSEVREGPVGANLQSGDQVSGQQLVTDASHDLTQDSAREPTTGEDKSGLGENLDILPPGAARRSTRTLPKLILVGEQPSMFSSLEAAMEVAIPGDVIELRTNRPASVSNAAMHLSAAHQRDKLVVRAGPGFEPVLAIASDHVPLISVSNVDLLIQSIHFAANGHPGSFIQIVDSDLQVESCTFTGPRSPEWPPAIMVTNHKPDGDRSALPLRVRLNRCFMRATGGILVCEGNDIDISADQSVFAFIHDGFAMGLGNGQTLRVKRSTILDTYLLHVNPGSNWMTRPFSFHMERSVFAHLACCPVLLIVRPAGVAASDPAMGPREILQKALLDFQASDNFAQFWEGWAIVEGHTTSYGFLKQRLIPTLPTIDDTLRFGPGVEHVRALIWQVGDQEAARLAARAVLPKDFAVRSTGSLAVRMKSGSSYGCDVSQLPVPPPSTLGPDEYTTE